MAILPYLALSLLSLGSISSAQQHQGDTISGYLPSEDGSEVSYFKVADPSGNNDHLTLINYQSLGSDGNRLNNQNVQRAVIMMAGLFRDAGDYMNHTLSALYKVPASAGPDRDSVSIVTPVFANEQDQGSVFPWDESSSTSTSNALVWHENDWAYGRNNIYPSSSTNISSFYVLDQLVDYYRDQNTFPNLKEIVVAGHSMGSQMVQRYATLTSVSSGRIPITFWPADPNSMVWLSTYRPIEIENCPSYDNWPEGFANYASDNQQYGRALVSRGRDAIRANYESKQVSYLRANQDKGDYTVTGCGAYSTGENRDVRFLNFMDWFRPSCDSPSNGNCDTVDYVDISHDAAGAFGSDAGIARLFTDNFDGNGNRARDFGERRTDGDNPYPRSG
ncbi:hypothetical protein Q7P37_000394 [Cladosporium fusiforme]